MARRGLLGAAALVLGALLGAAAMPPASALTDAGAATSTATTANATAPPRYTGPAFVIGDSVLLGARTCLQGRGWKVDALGSRQAAAATRTLSAIRSRLPHLVAVHVGTNGGVTDAQVDAIMSILGPRRIVVWVTVQLPDDGRYSHEARTNLTIRSAAWRYPNVRVADWNARSEPNLATWTWADHIHLQPAGCRAFAAIVDGTGRRGI